MTTNLLSPPLNWGQGTFVNCNMEIVLVSRTDFFIFLFPSSMDDVDIFQSIYHLGLTQSSSSVASMSSTSSSRDSRAGSFASPASTPSSRASSCSSEKHRPPRRRPIKQMVR